MSDDPSDAESDRLPELVIVGEEEIKRESAKRDHLHRMVVTYGAIFLLVLTQIVALSYIFAVGEANANWATAAVSAITTAAVAYVFSRSRQ